jgi:MerR family transcriptional regulator/heat shock protein HspR
MTPSRRIGDVARSFGLHPQTLRLYERAGLLRPRRSSGNVRRYADDDLDRLNTILKLTRDRGINLAGVEMILKLLERIDELERRLARRPRGASGRSSD